MVTMSNDAILLCIKRQEFMDDPCLLQRLYLHHKGFTSPIQNLECFTQLKALFLESNSLTAIENLDNLKHLEELHLEKNKIEKIENLQHLTCLKYLNLSQNEISKIEGLESLTCLETLIISENEISMTEFVKQIAVIPQLRKLDLSMNKINCNPESILCILGDCKSLRVLSLQGNPFVSSNKMPHYRSLIISHSKKLRQLDGRRICSEERRRCNAWGEVVLNGGTFDQANEADRQELLKIRLERSKKNASRRSSLSQSSICSSSDRSKGSIGSSVLEGVKRTFGIIESRTSSSEISNSSWSRRDLVMELDDEAEDWQNCISWNKVSDSSPRGVV